MAQKSFTAAAREFFGLKPDQKLTEFGAELKELTHADKVEMAAGMRASTGWDIADPIEAK